MAPEGARLLAVAVGGALGSAARYAVALWLAPVAPCFPAATLAVNVAGGLLMGLIAGIAEIKASLPEVWRLALATGLMGGFTTFSAFSIETLRLIERGQPLLGGVNVLANVCLSLAACMAGLALARALG